MGKELFQKLNKLSSEAKDKIKDLKRMTEGFDSCFSEVEMLIERLANHTRYPEVRILIFGPLKSGKSTLMNILARNFRVSQIDPRPAFPCVVEVRGTTDNNERSEFFKKDSEAYYMKCSIDESRKKMDILLHEYIYGTPSERPVKIVQYINYMDGFRNGGILKDGISMVLVDSPGLLFDDKDYTEETDKQRREADVAILLLRPEQLFFREINDIIRKALGGINERGNAYQHIFVIVNASSSAKQINSDGTSVLYNQIDKQEEIIQYFIKHVAADDIAVRLCKKEGISIDFIDLLETSRNLAEKNIESFKNSDQGLALRKVEEYLLADLVEEKIHKLNRDFAEIIKSGNELSTKLKYSISEKITFIKSNISNEQKVLNEHKDVFKEEEEKEHIQKREIAKLEEWSPSNIPNNWNIDLENNLRQWMSADHNSFEKQSLETELQRIVKRWLVPGNTLSGLYDRIFDDSVHSDLPSILKRYEDINIKAFDEAKRLWADIARRNKEDSWITEFLISALEGVRLPRITIPAKDDSIELFDVSGIVSKKLVILDKMLTLGLRVKHYWSIEEFWGNKGKQHLDRNRIEFLNEECKELWWSGKILDEPWGLWSKVFSPDAISRQLILLFRKYYDAVVKEKIFKEIKNHSSKLELMLKDKEITAEKIHNSGNEINRLNEELILNQNILEGINKWNEEWQCWGNAEK